MPSEFNGLICTKSEIQEKQTLETAYDKLKDKTKETEVDRVRRIHLTNRFKYGVEPEVSRADYLKFRDKDGKTTLDLPTRMDLYNHPELGKKLPQGIREKFEDGDIYKDEQARWLVENGGKTPIKKK